MISGIPQILKHQIYSYNHVTLDEESHRSLTICMTNFKHTILSEDGFMVFFLNDHNVPEIEDSNMSLEII